MGETKGGSVVLCDHTEVLEQALHKELIPTDKHFTVITAQEIVARQFGKKLDVSCLEPNRQPIWDAIENKYGDWTRQTFALVDEDIATHLLVSEIVLQTFIALGKYVWAGVAGDWSGANGTVLVLVGHTDEGKVLRPVLADYLSQNQVIYVDVGTVDDSRQQDSVSRQQLLKISRSNVILYSVFKRFLKYWPSKLSNGTVWLARENDLMKEAARNFVLGAAKKLIKLPMKPPKAQSENISDLQPLLEKIADNFSDNFGEFFSYASRAKVEAEFRKLVSDVAAEYRFYRKWWNAYLSNAVCLPDFVLTGFVASPYWVALAAECHLRGIKVISAQHGHSRGLSKKHSKNRLGIMEEVRSDILLSYDPASAEHAKRNPYGRAMVASAGLPRSYRAKHKKVLEGVGLLDYMYISVGQRSVVGSHMLGFPSDRAFFNFEQKVLEEVFSSEDRTVLYKNYPSDGLSERYLGRGYARSKPNVHYYDGELLVHQLAGHARALICMGPTSTLGWALASGRPVFYLLPPGGMLELPDFLELLRAAVFVVDLNEDEGSWENFRNTVYRDFDDILTEWNAKAPARDVFWSTYMCIDGEKGVRNTGKRLRAMMRSGGLLHKKCLE